MAATFFYFLLSMFCQFLRHHRTSGRGFIHRNSRIWQVCWWCQQWSQAWRTVPNLAAAQLPLISCLKPLHVPQAYTYHPDIFAIQNDSYDAAVCGENGLKREGKSLSNKWQPEYLSLKDLEDRTEQPKGRIQKGIN